jgi:hypothetical protein
MRSLFSFISRRYPFVTISGALVLSEQVSMSGAHFLTVTGSNFIVRPRLIT